MKKMLLSASVVILLMSCGGKSNSDTKTGDGKESASSIAMHGFMDKLDGKAMHTEAALKEYGKEGLNTADMEMYDLVNPEIKDTHDSCYLLECKSGITKRKYSMCWENGKISSVEDKGME